LADSGLDPSLVQTLVAIGSTAAGAMAGGTSGAGAAFNEVTNNYLTHTEATRLAELYRKKFEKQCDTSCEQEIADLRARDQARDQQLSNCSGVQSAACDTVRQDVRNAAAEYIRLGPLPMLLGRFESETPEGKTYRLAQETLDGVLAGKGKGYAGTIWNGVTGLLSAVGTGLEALFGDPAAQEKVKTGAGAAYDYITDLNNLPYLLGALTPEQREQLAQAYERGDGETVGKMLGEQAANIPVGGGGLGTIKKVDKVLDVANAAKKAEKVADAAADAARAAEKVGAGLVDDLAKFRKELGLPPAGSAMDKSALAVIEVNGQKIYGINAHGQPVSGVNIISSTHAEIDALNQIKQRGIDVSGQSLTLYVDRAPCTACGANGGIRSMVEQLNLKQLTVIGPDGSTIIAPR